MGKIDNYKLDFPKRTLILLTSFKKREVEYSLDVTLLINCLLGLVVTAVETSKNENILPGPVDDEFIKALPKNVYIKEKRAKLRCVNSIELKKWDKIRLLGKIRNGIAHQHVEPINNNGQWVGIKLWNENDKIQDRTQRKDFEISFTIDQLYSLSLYITKHYLNKYNQKKYDRQSKS